MAAPAVALFFVRVRIAIEAERALDGPASARVSVTLGPVPIVRTSTPRRGARSAAKARRRRALLRAVVRRSRAAWPRVRPLLRWFLGRVGWGGLLEALAKARSDIRVLGLEGRVEYALEDPALEGELYAHLSAWLLIVDPEGRFALIPRWTFENRWAGRVRAVVDLRAIRVLARLAGLIAWQVWRGPAPRAAEAPARG
jgi:hypothetical protein